MIEILTETMRDLEKITEQDIQRVQRQLGKIKPNEKPLGTIHNETLRRLWTLADRYDGMSRQAAHDAMYISDTEEQTSAKKRDALRYDSLEDIARLLFWTQVKDDLSGWDHESIGVRENWMLVSCESAKSQLAAFLGALQIPSE